MTVKAFKSEKKQLYIIKQNKNETNANQFQLPFHDLQKKVKKYNFINLKFIQYNNIKVNYMTFVPSIFQRFLQSKL